jgi:MFS family permease
MEMIERLAFYGVRTVATIYATRPESTGGLGVTMATFGTLLLFWNLVQSLIPIFTGGLSDRYGYKQTIFASTIVKTLGYLFMAWFPSYWGFFAGAMLLATGTAIFKPGVQGTLIKATNRRNSSMAWGIFYQTVNIGGWIGPLIALQMRLLAWKYVFYTNAAVICCNFLLLLTYREPGKEERLARQKRLREGKEKQGSLALEALAELKKPHLSLYLIIFSVWWLMFPMIWDVLPKYIEDWVDTAPMVRFLFGADGTQSGFWKFLLGMDDNGLTIQPEGVVNINSGMIMVTCFLFAGLSAKMRATTSMVVGTVFVVIALAIFGLSTGIGFAVLGMLIFSVGEMLASPKFSEFLGNIAPADKKAMWIGFSQAPMLVGWTIEGKLGPQLYHIFSAKDEFARQVLADHGLSPAQVAAVPIGEAFNKLVQVTGQSPAQLTHALYQSHHVALTWYVFAAIGVASAVMIYLYGQWILKLARRQEAEQAASGPSPAQPATTGQV